MIGVLKYILSYGLKGQRVKGLLFSRGCNTRSRNRKLEKRIKRIDKGKS
jgi:hypothetical protein